MGYKLKRILIYPDGVTEKQVYPVWKPGSNTMLYVPMEDDILDHSGNSVVLTQSGTLTLTTLNGVKCASTNVSGVYADFSNDWTNLTISGWIYDTKAGTNIECIYGGLGSSLVVGNMCFGNWDNKYQLNFVQSSSSMIYPGVQVDKNSWQLITAIKNGNTWQYYKNTTSLGTVSFTGGYNSKRVNLGGRFYTSQGFEGYMGGWVVESKVRTSDDISKYYNLTKGNYGIS